MKNRIKQSRSPVDIVVDVLIYIFYSVFTFLCVYPFYYIFINTISNNKLSERGAVIWLPQQIHFQNYIDAFRIPNIANAALVSLARAGIVTLLVVLSSAFMGYMFTSETMWKRKFWYRFIIITMYFNAGIIPWYLTMRNLGLTNNFLGYVLPAVVSPFYIILTKTFIESMPKELKEAARIDGAGTLLIFGRIILPLSKPIMATIAIFSAVNQWNAFQDTLLLMTNEKLYTLQFILYRYLQSASSLKSMLGSSGAAAALASSQTTTSIRMTVTIIVALPILLVYPFFQRFFVKGIMIGAVKG